MRHSTCRRVTGISHAIRPVGTVAKSWYSPQIQSPELHVVNTADLEFYGKRHTDFDLRRIAKAQAQGFDQAVTAYLCGAFIEARAGVGVVFGHNRKDQYGRFEDGHLIRTSDVVSTRKEGRFWVMTTVNSRYVIATFKRGDGRQSLREFQSLAKGQLHLTPHVLQ